jgi:ribosomal protein S18 acetylase RimI-like enzyme
MATPSVAIVPARPEDEHEIIPWMAAFNEGEGIPWRSEPMGAALRRLLLEPALGLILVARDRVSRAIVGYGVATFGYDLEFAGSDAFVTELFVAPAFRGRGVGRDVLDALVQRLRDCGTNAVHLVVRPENARARALYEDRGFRVVPRILMTKRLDIPEA